MSYYLAIDAGGTKTDYLLADDTRELARVRTGTIKRMRADADAATANLEQALEELTAQTGISMQSIHCTCIGTAGYTVPLVTDWLHEEIPSRVAGSFLLLGDIEIALDAAFFGKPGVLAIAGTGSNVAGRDATGKLIGAGGYGPALADQGSGHRIGHEALRALFLATDRGIDTTLLPAVLKFWNLTSLDDIVAFANRVPAPDFSQLTELVVRCAANGDAVAANVLHQQGEELGELVRLTMHRVKAASTDAAFTPPVAFTGSILEKVLPVREALIASLQRDFPTVHVLPGTVDPIEGALWRARNGQ
ncbi:ATPase [Granulicella sp. 5B5]|uniref:N-acetylglucosamine kinase n=1 Tax=Granulicella sp. 5B5 TaxID=1617967 RepID=UPI0015F6A8D9|nr:BadF/BadG/BcrA/BcrD ATPase family protein [Granulicella sp. 5B5]QMV19420.1 ATPase [Granulicella sp. 5B5]